MYIMIDNFDSFVYNLNAYFQELGREILVKRCDEITLKELEEMNPEGIILSPGPKRPWDAKLCVDTVKKFQGRIPILGGKGSTSHARKSNRDPQLRNRCVCRPAGEI